MTEHHSPAGFRGFPRTFWVANSVELLERAAYYGVFIVITNKKLTKAQLKDFVTRWHYGPIRMVWEGEFLSIQPIGTTF